MLIGKIVKLPKPLVIISTDDDDDDNNDDDKNNTGTESNNNNAVDNRKKRRLIEDEERTERDHGVDGANSSVDVDGSWNVVGIVRKKLLFKTRPQPVIAKVSERKKSAFFI